MKRLNKTILATVFGVGVIVMGSSFLSGEAIKNKNDNNNIIINNLESNGYEYEKLVSSNENTGLVLKDPNGISHLYMWGANNSGQIGDGQTRMVSTPEEINVDGGDQGFQGEVTNFVIDSSINYHDDSVVTTSVIIKKDGVSHFYAWGDNSEGQFGNGTKSDSLTPEEINVDGGDQGIQGDVVNFGMANLTTSIAIKDSDGKSNLYVWGNNFNGQVGKGTHGGFSEHFSKPYLTWFSGDSNEEIKKLVVGRTMALVSKDDENISHIYMWGANNNYLISAENDQDITEPKEIKLNNTSGLGTADEITSFSLGYDHAILALKNELGISQIWTWGNNTNGQLGNGTTETAKVDSPVIIDKTESGESFSSPITYTSAQSSTTSFAYEEENISHIYMWGKNGWGQIGDGTTEDVLTPEEINVDKGASGIQGYITKISNNGSSSLVAIKNENISHLYGWGRNYFGELGIGSKNVLSAPIEIDFDGEKSNRDEIIDYSLADDHTIISVRDSNNSEKIYTWGNNDNYQLGNGSDKEELTPIELSLIDNAQVSMLDFAPLIVDNTAKLNLNVNLNPDLNKLSDFNVNITAEDANDSSKKLEVTTDGELNGDEIITISGFDYGSITDINLYFISDNNKDKTKINDSVISINIPEPDNGSNVSVLGIALASTIGILLLIAIIIVVIYILKKKKTNK